MTRTAFVGTTIITCADSGNRWDDAAMVVTDDKITAIGPREEVLATSQVDHIVDAGGGYLMPGMWDAHLHLGALVPPHENAHDATDPRHHMVRCIAKVQENLRWGITSVRSLGERDSADLLVRDLVGAGTLPGARVVASGDVAWTLAEAGVDNFRRKVRRQALQGVDQIKLMITGGIPMRGGITSPTANRQEVKAAIAEAHDWGRPVAVHAMGDEAVIMAVECGADTIEHAFGCTPAAAQAMADAGTVYCPNLAVTDEWPRYLAAAGLQPWLARNADAARAGHHETLAAAVELGVTVIAGVDSLPRPTGAYGIEMIGGDPALIGELALLRANGLSARETLRSTTINTARVCGLGDELGSLEVGKIADFIVLEADPETDVRNLGAVSGVWQSGQRSALAPPSR